MDRSPKLFIVAPTYSDFERICKVYGFTRPRALYCATPEEAEKSIALRKSMGIEAVAVILHASTLTHDTPAPWPLALVRSEG
jgi:hypothetical protein